MPESPRLARCGDEFPAPPMMRWTPPPCDKPDGHKGDHRSSSWLNTPPYPYAEQRFLTCTWPDKGRPNPTDYEAEDARRKSEDDGNEAVPPMDGTW